MHTNKFLKPLKGYWFYCWNITNFFKCQDLFHIYQFHQVINRLKKEKDVSQTITIKLSMLPLLSVLLLVPNNIRNPSEVSDFHYFCLISTTFLGLYFQSLSFRNYAIYALLLQIYEWLALHCVFFSIVGAKRNPYVTEGEG